MSKSMIHNKVKQTALEMYAVRMDMALDHVAEMSEQAAAIINGCEHEKLSQVGSDTPGIPELLCHANIVSLCDNLKLSEFDQLEDSETMIVEIIRIYRRYKHEVRENLAAVIQDQAAVDAVLGYLINA